MTSNVIEARAVVKRFGKTCAVDGVDLTVPEGELLGLIGPNGAGKTTLFKLILGLDVPTSGDIRVCGEPVRGEAFRRVRRSIGYLPESVALYENLTGLETMRFFARLKGADPASCARLLDKVGLADAGRRSVSEYSKGMKQRLAFGQALLGTPRILLLDEPTNGLDPQGIRDFYAILERLRTDGLTAILSSHVLAEIQQRVDRLALMMNGRIRALGTLRSLREESNFPLSIQVKVHNGAAGMLRPTLLESEVIRMTGSTAHLQCERSRKMAVLNALSSLGPQVLDIHVEEPSLEDIFLRHTDRAS